jgi:hypothetical protein
VTVFRDEIDAGLEPLILASASVCTASRAVFSGREVNQDTLDRLRATAGSGTNLSLPDLYPIDFVLASTGANLNDDFFTTAETWGARQSPVDKPFNEEHKAAVVIGHMTAARVLAEDGSVFTGDSAPDAFHVGGSAVLYRHWPGYPDRQEWMNRAIAELDNPTPENAWFVSMECRFRGFDYLLAKPAGSDGTAIATADAELVERNDSTAFLTKHLRAYGGTGKYRDRRVLRVFKNLTFSGVGLVRVPANPQSVILPPTSGATAKKISKVFSVPGYETASGNNKADQKEVSVNELDKLKAELAEANKKLDEARQANFEKQVQDLTAAKTAIAADLETAKAGLVAKDAELTAAKTALATTEAAKAELAAQLDKVKEETAKAEAARKQADRVVQVRTAYGFESDEKALATVTTLASLPDEAFAAHLATITELKKGVAVAPPPPAPAVQPTEAEKAAAAAAAVTSATQKPAETQVDLTATSTATADDAAQALASEMLNYFGHKDPGDDPDGDDQDAPGDGKRPGKATRASARKKTKNNVK